MLTGSHILQPLKNPAIHPCHQAVPELAPPSSSPQGCHHLPWESRAIKISCPTESHVLELKYQLWQL